MLKSKKCFRVPRFLYILDNSAKTTKKFDLFGAERSTDFTFIIIYVTFRPFTFPSPLHKACYVLRWLMCTTSREIDSTLCVATAVYVCTVYSAIKRVACSYYSFSIVIIIRIIINHTEYAGMPNEQSYNNLHKLVLCKHILWL